MAASSAFFPANYVTLKQLKEKREEEERRRLQLKDEEDNAAAAAAAAAKRQIAKDQPQKTPKPRASHQRWIAIKPPPFPILDNNGDTATASARGVSKPRPPPPAGISASNLEATPGPKGSKKNGRKKKKKGTGALTVKVDCAVVGGSPVRNAVEAEAKGPVVGKVSGEDRKVTATGGGAVVVARGLELRSYGDADVGPVAAEGPSPAGRRRSNLDRRAVGSGYDGGGWRLPSGLVWVRKNHVA